MGTTIAQPSQRRQQQESRKSSKLDLESKAVEGKEGEKHNLEDGKLEGLDLDGKTPYFVHLVSHDTPQQAPDQSMSSIHPQQQGIIPNINRLISDKKPSNIKQKQMPAIAQDSYDAKRAYQKNHSLPGAKPRAELPSQPIIRNRPKEDKSSIAESQVRPRTPELLLLENDEFSSEGKRVTPDTEVISVAGKGLAPHLKLDEMSWEIPAEPEIGPGRSLKPSSSIIMDVRLAEERGDYGAWEGRKRIKSRRQLMHEIAGGKEVTGFQPLSWMCMPDDVQW